MHNSYLLRMTNYYNKYYPSNHPLAHYLHLFLPNEMGEFMRYKGLNSVITSIILIMLISLATGGCGSGGGAKSDNSQKVAVNPTPVIPDIDLTQSKLNSGKLVTGTPKEDCDNSVVLDAVNELCKLLAPLTGVDACVTQSSPCNSHER